MASRLVLLFLLLTTITFAQEKSAPDPLLPEYLRNVPLGMTLGEFSKIKDVKSMEAYEGFDFRLELTETVIGNEVTAVVYYFDLAGDKPLYEYIIDYSGQSEAEAAARKLLGEPNDEDGEWRFLLDGTTVGARQFSNRLVIFAAFPKTEYDPVEQERARKELDKEIESLDLEN